MKNRWKKLMLIIGTVCMMSLTVYGCGGSVEESSEPDIQTEAPQNEETEEPADEEGTQEGSENTGEEATQEDSENTDEEAQDQPEGVTELEGDIREINDGSFVVCEITVIEEDGAEIMVVGAPGNEEDMNLITVRYDEDTEFIKQKIWNGGADHEEREGSPEDLEEDFTAEMEGSYVGEEFHADRIKIIEVILQ